MKPPANGAFIMGQNSMNAVLGSLVIEAMLRALSIRLTGTTIVVSVHFSNQLIFSGYLEDFV